MCLRERCGVAPFCEVLLLSPLYSTFLPPELLQAECAQEMLLSLSLLISPAHSLTLPLPFSSCSLSLGTPSPPPPPLSCHHPPTSLATCVCRAAALWCCVPCATTGRGFLLVCIRWSSQMETPSTLLCKPHLHLPPSLHSSIVSTLLLSFPLSLFPPLRAHGCDRECSTEKIPPTENAHVCILHQKHRRAGLICIHSQWDRSPSRGQ